MKTTGAFMQRIIKLVNGRIRCGRRREPSGGSQSVTRGEPTPRFLTLPTSSPCRPTHGSSLSASHSVLSRSNVVEPFLPKPFHKSLDHSPLLLTSASALLYHPRSSYPDYMQNEIELHLQFVQHHNQFTQGSAFGCSSEIGSFRGLVVYV
jgi:hypothetical protein